MASVVKEIIWFRLPLGAKTDEFLALYRQVREEQQRHGINPGVWWSAAFGTRVLMIEREFDSLAAYEADDRAFHAGEELMTLWRQMEACAESMESQLWQTRCDPAEVTALRGQR